MHSPIGKREGICKLWKIGSHRRKANEGCRPCPEDVYSMTSWMRKAGLVWSALEIKTHSLDFHFHNKPARSLPVLHFFNLQNEAVARLLKWQSAAFLAWPVTPNEYPAQELSSSECFRAPRALHDTSLMGWSAPFTVMCVIHQKCIDQPFPGCGHSFIPLI